MHLNTCQHLIFPPKQQALLTLVIFIQLIIRQKYAPQLQQQNVNDTQATHNYKRCVHKLPVRILLNIIGWVKKVTRSLDKSAQTITWTDLHNKTALPVVSIL